MNDLEDGNFLQLENETDKNVFIMNFIHGICKVMQVDQPASKRPTHQRFTQLMEDKPT